MAYRTHPPFSADHVGSFLRPKRLLEARERRKRGELSGEGLRALEDEAIREIVKFQEDVGLESITDGEFRRTCFHIDFLEQLGGVKTDIPVTVIKSPQCGFSSTVHGNEIAIEAQRSKLQLIVEVARDVWGWRRRRHS